MNVVNSLTTSIFNVVLIPFEWLGPAGALIGVSGIFGVVALIAFKKISWQEGIKLTKDKIKGHLIEIRIYQDDLVVVAVSVLKILWRNLQYLTLNFGPFIPLAIPFVLVTAQFAVRYAFDPIPVAEAGVETLAGKGTLVQIQMAKGHESEVAGLQLELPDGLRAVSPLVRVPSEGRAFQEVVGTQSGAWDLTLRLADGTTGTKRILTGDTTERVMQPERVQSFWSAWLWPAEDTFGSDSPFARVAFTYPDRDLGWLPGGLMGILVTFIVASMLFGVIALKPLGVQI